MTQTEIDQLIKKAESGDAEAMHALAINYRDGNSVEQNFEKFLDWLTRLRKRFGFSAEIESILSFQDRPESDLDSFVEWVKARAGSGSAISMEYLSVLYREGIGVEQSLDLYKEWIRLLHLAGYAKPSREENFISAGFQQSILSDTIEKMRNLQEFENGNLDARLNLLLEYDAIKDPDFSCEIAINFKKRNRVGDDERSHQWLLKAESFGDIRAFILRSIYKARRSGLLNQSTDIQLTSALIGLSEKVEAIKQQHLIHDSDVGMVQVAHFTTLEALHSILPVNEISYAKETHTLRLYNIAYMNDPQEGRRLLDLKQKNAVLLRKFFAKAHQGNNHNFLWENQEFSVYCGSFTLRIDRLDLWRAYGLDGLGYCLVIPSKSFQQEQESGRSSLMHDAVLRGDENHIETKANQRKVPVLYRIHYDQKQAEEALDTLKENLEPLQKMKRENSCLKELINSLVRIIVSDILYLYKNEEYASEEEARMIVAHNITDKVLKLDDNQPPRIYVETDAFLFRDEGTRIIIGPKVGDKVAAELNLKYRLARHGLLKTTSVEWSQVKYR